MPSLQARITKLEIENLKLKTDLARRKDLDYNYRYYDLYSASLKEIAHLKSENASLKAEIEILKTSRTPLETQASEVSSFEADEFFVKNDFLSDDEQPMIEKPIPAIIEIGSIESTNSTDHSKSKWVTKRPRSDDGYVAIAPKRTKFLFDRPWWRCSVCTQKSSRYESIKELQTHIINSHPKRTLICDRCPYTAVQKKLFEKHQRIHDPNDEKFEGSDQVRVCKLCDAYFETDAALRQHDSRTHW